MKNKFPEYKSYRDGTSDLIDIEKKMSKKNVKIMDDFCKYCSATAGAEKVKKIRRLLIQLYDVTEIDLDKQDKKSLTEFFALLNNSNRSIPTKNETKSYIKKFLKWHYRDFDLLDFLQPVLRRERFEVNTEKVNEGNLVTDEDIERMLRCAETYKDKAFLFLSFQTGARPEELINLRWKNIKFYDKHADINLFSNKTKKSRIFPVTKAREFLWDWKQNYSFFDVKETDYVFPSRFSRDKPMTTAGGNKILRKMAKKAGINKDFWNYLNRHTRCTRLYEELPTPIVEKLMGHTDMYRTYAHISTQKARDELLNKIYKIEKLTPKDKKEIKELKEEISDFKNKFNSFIQIFFKDNPAVMDTAIKKIGKEKVIEFFN